MASEARLIAEDFNVAVVGLWASQRNQRETAEDPVVGIQTLLA